MAEIPTYNAAVDLIGRNLAAGRGAKTAFIDDHGHYSYADLADRVHRFANAMRAHGVEREQRILLCLHDGIDFPTAFLGAIEAGIVPVAVNTQLSADEFAFMLADSRARAIIVSAPILPVMQKALGLLSGPKPSIIVSDPANKGSGLASLLAEAATVRRCRLDPPRRTMLLALFVRLDRPSKRDDPRPQEPDRDSGILRHPGSRDRRDRHRLFGGKTVFRLRARQRVDLSAGGRRHKHPRRRTSEPRAGRPHLARAATDDFLRCANPLQCTAREC